MDHGLVAAILNDYFNIAVRNECFCAHPYVEQMLHKTHKKELDQCESKNDQISWKIEPWMGMVRASFGLYNNRKDVNILITAIDNIIANKIKYKDLYFINENNDYEHKEFKFSSNDFFSLTEIIDKDINSL
jgi:cysteine desulfurase/selenocysteine lyase